MAKVKKVTSKDDMVLCPHCKEKNVISATKCISCGKELNGSKSCPRCAKINDKKNKKCINCGYKFNNRKKSFLFSFIFCLLLLIVLFLLLVFDQEKTVLRFTDSVRWVAIGVIALMVISTFTYGKKEKIDYDDKYGSNKKLFSSLKSRSVIIVAIGFIVAACVALYLFFTNK